MKINKSTLSEFFGNLAFNLSLNPLYQFWGFVYGIASTALLSGLFFFVPVLWGKLLYAIVIGFTAHVTRSFYNDLKESGSLTLK